MFDNKVQLPLEKEATGQLSALHDRMGRSDDLARAEAQAAKFFPLEHACVGEVAPLASGEGAIEHLCHEEQRCLAG